MLAKVKEQLRSLPQLTTLVYGFKINTSYTLGGVYFVPIVDCRTKGLNESVLLLHFGVAP